MAFCRRVFVLSRRVLAPWRRRTSNATTYVSQLERLYSLEQQHDEDRIKQLLVTHRCEAVYLDVGSNIGVQIRKLFEPHKYPGAPVHSLFTETFASTDRCRVCAIGVEPNPRHRNRLSQLQTRLTAAGAGVTVFEAAAGSADGVLTLQYGARKSHFEDAGASTLGISSLLPAPATAIPGGLTQEVRRGQSERS